MNNWEEQQYVVDKRIEVDVRIILFIAIPHFVVDIDRSGDQGVNISGGQRQRISIAREFLRETPMLILDEATSALDTETEQLIQESINEYQGKKTIIIIAHRLSTIKNCDKIFVLDEGRIVEQGDPESLLRKRESLFGKIMEDSNQSVDKIEKLLTEN